MDRFTGSTEFEKLLASTRAAVREQADQDCMRSAKRLVSRLKRTIPKGDPRNGHIRNSLKTVREGEADYLVTFGDDAHPYAAALEFGHKAPDGSRVPPQKVFFPSVTRENKAHRARLKRNFKKIIKG